jgi:hypothetical protein
VTRTHVFVEGRSDALALETLARRRGRDLGVENVDIVAIHGVTNIGRHLDATPGGARVAGLCDAGEQRAFRRAFDRRAGVLDVLGCFVCEPDLESELIRAVGADGMIAVIDREGELDSFRTLQGQPAHRGQAVEGQLHRFIGTRSGRKLRYAGLLVDALDLSAMPRPLHALLAAVRPTPDRGAPRTFATDATPFRR